MRTFTRIATIALLVTVGCRQSSERTETGEVPQKGVEPAPSADMDRPGMERPGTAQPGTAQPGMDQPGMDQPAKDILGVAREAGNFNTLITAIEAAGLRETLSGPGPLTVFAPTDEAFAKIPKAQLDALLADKEKLRAVLTNHVVQGKLLAADLSGGKMTSLKTASGRDLPVDAKEGVKIGTSRVVMADIPASNGVIHAIDTVLIPEGSGPQARASDEEMMPPSGGM